MSEHIKEPDRPLTPAQLAELDAMLAAARYGDNLTCLDADVVSRWDGGGL